MDAKKIGLFIQQLRKEKGMTQEDLAEICYVVRESVSKWERGINIPDKDILIILSNYFDLTINEILYGERMSNENKLDIELSTVNVMEEHRKQVVKYRIFILFIIISFILTILYYTYINNVNLYKFTVSNDNIDIHTSYVYTDNKNSYIFLGNIKYKNKTISRISIYYKDLLLYDNMGNVILNNKIKDLIINKTINIKINYNDNSNQVIQVNLEKIK